MSEISDALRALGDAVHRSADLLDRVEEMTAERPLTLGETASVLRIDERTVRRYISSSRLAAFKVGNAWRIPRSAIAEMVDTHKAAS